MRTDTASIYIRKTEQLHNIDLIFVSSVPIINWTNEVFIDIFEISCHVWINQLGREMWIRNRRNLFAHKIWQRNRLELINGFALMTMFLCALFVIAANVDLNTSMEKWNDRNEMHMMRKPRYGELQTECLCQVHIIDLDHSRFFPNSMAERISTL